MTSLKIERFQIIQEIFQERYATVFEALNTENKQSVHLHLYPENYLINDKLQIAFNKRRESSANLNHPGLIPIYHSGRIWEQTYAVYPVMGGGSLTQLLRNEGSLPPDQIVPIAQRIASALDALHLQQIVHGNLTTEAVWFNADEVAYLGGYLLPPPEPENIEDLSPFSPEYLEDRPLKRQSDIYSLSILLYKMLTGKSLFDGLSAEEIKNRLLAGEIPSVGEFRADNVRELDRFFRLGLEYNLNNRPLFASELVLRFKNIFRFSPVEDQGDTAIHDQFNEKSTQVNVNSDSEYSPDFASTPDWMFVYEKETVSKQQDVYETSRFDIPFDLGDYNASNHPTNHGPDKRTISGDDLDQTNIYHKPEPNLPESGNTSIFNTLVGKKLPPAGTPAPSQEAPVPNAVKSRSTSWATLGMIGLVIFVFFVGIILFGLSVYNVVRQTDPEPNLENEGVVETDAAAPLPEEQIAEEIIVESDPVEAEDNSVINVPVFDLNQADGTVYVAEQAPISTTFLRRSRTAEFSEEQAGWHLYSNGNKIRDVIQVDNKIYAASGSGLTIWDLDANSGDHLTNYDGLVGNDINQIVYCEIPDPTLLVASESGLGIHNLITGDIEIFDVGGRQLISNQVSTAACSFDGKTAKLYVGYTNDGLTIHDLNENERDRIDRSDGLPTDAVHQILLIDEKIWINTGNSILVFDESNGITQAYSKSDNSLPAQTISEMVWDSENSGLVWMATNEGLLAANPAGGFTLYTAENTNLPRGLGTSVGVDPKGNVWFGTGFGNVCVFDITTLSCVATFNHPQDTFEIENAITSIDVSDGRLIYGHQNDGVWVGNFVDNSIETANYKTDEWFPLYLPNQFPTNEITALSEADGFVWVGTRRGLYKAPLDDLSGENWEYLDASNSPLPANWITSLFPDPDGGMWIGTFKGAVYLGSVWLQDPILLDQQIRAISKDPRENNIWLGTERGVFLYDGRAVSELKDLPTVNVRTMLWSGDDLYIGLEDGRVGVLSGGVFNLFDRNNSPLSADPVTVIKPGANDTLFIGNGDDLYILNQARTMVQVPEVNGFYVSDVIYREQTKETLVSTTGNSLFYYDSIDWQKVTVRDGLPTDRIGNLLVDSLGTIWFAGQSTNDQGGGLARYIPFPAEE